MILPGNLYGVKAKGVFRNEYEYPSLSVVDEWVSCIAPLLQDLITPDGEETVLLEAFLLQITLLYFNEKDIGGSLSKLQKAEDIISNAVHVPSELIMSFFTWGGILCENGNPG